MADPTNAIVLKGLRRDFGDRIGANRHPAESGVVHILQQFEQTVGNLQQAFGAECHLFAVQVVGTFLPRSQHDMAEPEF